MCRCILQEIIKAQGRTSNSAGECYIDPESLREEFQRSLVAKISSRQASAASLMYPVPSSVLTQQLLLILRQVLDIIREIDTTGTDRIVPRDFVVFMDAKAGDESSA